MHKIGKTKTLKQRTVCKQEQPEVKKYTANTSENMKKIFSEIIAENFPNIRNEMDIHIKESYRITKRQAQKRTSPRRIIMEMPKTDLRKEH